jgi:hypothetical protein
MRMIKPLKMIPIIFTLEDDIEGAAGSDSPGEKVGVVMFCTVMICMRRVTNTWTGAFWRGWVSHSLNLWGL